MLRIIERGGPLTRALAELASGLQGFRRAFFVVVLVVSGIAAALVGLGAVDEYLLPGRLPVVRNGLLVWALLHPGFWLLARRRASLAYTVYVCGAQVILTAVFQSLRITEFDRINYQLPHTYSLLFVALVLLSYRRFLVFSTVITGLAIAWSFAATEGPTTQLGVSVPAAVSLNVLGLWALSLVVATLVQMHYARLVESRAALARHAEDLEHEVELKTATIRKQQEGLFQSQKLDAVAQLAGGLAHDLNSLMTVVIGYADLVLANPDVGGGAKGDVEGIRRAAERASTLMRRLLTFSRRDVVQPREVEVARVLEGLKDMLERLASRRCPVALDLDDEQGRVLIDPIQLEQVALNLVGNARDALPGGGPIQVRTRSVTLSDEDAQQRAGAAAGPYVLLSVEDSGIGMDEATRHRLFEPFFTTKAPGKGTGLGLATVYGIVTQADGFIEVESTPGEGSVFRVFLPRRANARPVVDTQAVAARAEAVERVPERATVLVVDDQPEVTRLVEQILGDAGYSVLTARDGEDAVAVARGFDGHIDLVVMDVVFPGLSGPDAVREIRASRPQAKALFMSSYADETVARHGLTGPEAPFLAKPFRPEALLRRVRELLAAERTREVASAAVRPEAD